MGLLVEDEGGRERDERRRGDRWYYFHTKKSKEYYIGRIGGWGKCCKECLFEGVCLRYLGDII